jgi:exopolysaccharide biosynthesis polyprenyl glycosylphosphotransferase
MLCALFAIGAMTVAEGNTGPLWALAALPLWVFLAKLEGLYDNDHPRIWHLTSDEARAIFHWVTLSAVGTLFFIRLLPDVTITVSSAGVLWFSAMVTALPLRAGARAIWRGTASKERALVLGSDKLAAAVTRKLALEPGHHLILVQAPDHVNGNNRPNGDAVAERLRIDQLSKEDLDDLISQLGVERVVLAVPELDEKSLARVVSVCRSAGVKLSVVPPLRAMLGTAVHLTHIAEMPVIEYGTWDTPPSTMAFKRAVDILISALALVLLMPLLLAIALTVRLESRGPALFRQVRAGRHGKPFRILKFRTMCHDAEQRIGEVISVDQLEEPMFKLRKDPRVTRVGRFLRRTSLDELPQLFNVLKGDMSLIGPRPEELWLVERYTETQRFRLEMRPGLTGPMQVHGRGDLTFQERLAVEREYVENYTFDKDVRISLRTMSTIFGARGAY